MGEIRVPPDFRAVVTTPPARVDSATLPLLQQAVKALGLDEFDGHRIVHMHQVEHIDSAGVAGLLDIIRVAKQHGREFLMCDPPPIVRSYVEVYGASGAIEGRILSSANDGTYHTPLLYFVPPFVPHAAGRIDAYTDGTISSFELGGKQPRRLPPVDLASHPPKAPTRASRMEVHVGEQRRELISGSYVHVRKHNCGCGTTHETFDRLHALHDWFRNKGFDFVQLELAASDLPAGVVAERMAFRDRLHFEQFQTLLKIDTGWHKIGAPMEHLEEEFYYTY